MNFHYICTIKNTLFFRHSSLKGVWSRLDPNDASKCIDVDVDGIGMVAEAESVAADGCLAQIWDRCIIGGAKRQIYYEFKLINICSSPADIPLLPQTHLVAEIRLYNTTCATDTCKEVLNLYSCLTRIHHGMIVMEPTLVDPPITAHAPKLPIILDIDEWNCEVGLNEGQLATVQSMVERESTSNTIHFVGPWKLGPHMFLNLRRGRFFLSEHSISPENYQSKGAVLNCNTGTGKTAMSLALSTQPIHKRTIGLRECKAALIVVPINLATQWVEEIAKFLPGAKVGTITDVRQLKKHRNNYQDFDFVITTQSFLKGKSYEQVVQDAASCSHCLPRRDSIRHLDTGLRKVLAKKIIHECEEGTVLPLECFYWSRIFIDEIHEIFMLSQTQRANLISSLRCLSAGYVWGLTAIDGTKPLFYSLATGLALFFCGENCDFDIDPDISLALCQLLSSRLFVRRNFEEFINYEQFVHLICASSLERAAIEAQPTSRRALESCTNLAGCGAIGDDVFTASTNEEVVEKMKADTTNEMQSSTTKIQQINGFLSATNGDFLEPVRQRQLILRGTLETKLQNLQTRLRFLETVLETSEQECPVCLTNEPTTMFACGHKFCLSCATKIRAINFKCAVCRSVSDKFYRVSAERSKGSCKLIILLNLLEKICKQNESAIIFVQWTSAMIAAWTFLNTMGINAIRLCGNTHARSKQIQQFVNREKNVLFLSFETSNSGLNLVTANHVVFLHALNGVSSAEMEKQAIARVCRMGQTRPVSVHHLLIKDSIEETVFKKRQRSPLIEINH